MKSAIAKLSSVLDSNLIVLNFHCKSRKELKDKIQNGTFVLKINKQEVIKISMSDKTLTKFKKIKDEYMLIIHSGLEPIKLCLIDKIDIRIKGIKEKAEIIFYVPEGMMIVR